MTLALIGGSRCLSMKEFVADGAPLSKPGRAWTEDMLGLNAPCALYKYENIENNEPMQTQIEAKPKTPSKDIKTRCAPYWMMDSLYGR